MDFISVPPPPRRPEAERIAEDLLAGVNNELKRRVTFHKTSYAKFWKSYDVTPDEILDGMGQNAILFVASASENVQHITRLAGVIGKQLTDFIPAQDVQPPRDFVIDGIAVSLADPAPGHDAWGRLLPQSEWETDVDTGWAIHPVSGLLAGEFGWYDKDLGGYVDGEGNLKDPQPDGSSEENPEPDPEP